MWDCDPDSSFGAIFKIETQGGICEFLLYGKSDLEKLAYRQDNGYVMKLSIFEIGRIKTLNHYLKYLQDQGNFPEDKDSFRFNSISRSNYQKFRFHPSKMSIISPTGDLYTTHPPNLRSPSTTSSAATHTPAEYFKKCTKRDDSLFKTFTDRKFWDN